MKRIVSIGAHPDDVEQGMGGTIAKHASKGDDVHVIVCTLGIGGACGDPQTREREAQEAANILGARLHILDYSVIKLNRQSLEFDQILSKAIHDLSPDRVYTHSPYDYHQVHEVVSKSATRVAKDMKQLIYYEDISSTNPDFKANAYVDITDYIDLKIKSLKVHYTQSHRSYLQENLMRSLAYTRYAMGKVGSNYNGMAEAFAIHKFVYPYH